ncbi:Fur family transcriptional regulator [Amycolatopsis lurida]
MSTDRSGARLRSTRQRTAVMGLLGEIDTFQSAQYLYEQLRLRGEDIGLSTVYRTLQALVDAGQADMLRRGNGEAVYRRCSSRRHHHLVCRGCGRAVEVDGPAVERWAQRVAAANGFSDITCTVEVFGSCPDCLRRSPAIVDSATS